MDPPLILFHDRCHPRDLGSDDVTRFLSALATDAHVSASTQNQAMCALLFLYQAVLQQPLPAAMEGIVAARKPQTLPVVLTRSEVRAVLAQLTGVPALVASLLYGAGLRLLECLELRVKDIDFESHQVTVRQGKGRKDRVTMLPASAAPALHRHLAQVRRTHEQDLASTRTSSIAAGWAYAALPTSYSGGQMARRRHSNPATPSMSVLKDLATW